jgi:hypothetical protein
MSFPLLQREANRNAVLRYLRFRVTITLRHCEASRGAEAIQKLWGKPPGLLRFRSQ